MGDLTTLIQGPSGTGKELVARAIALSRYVPFDPATETFAENPAGAVFPLNLAALSPTLIEAELFGHRRGAFTGALEDRKGWFEVCPPLGTVFLDEIGEVGLGHDRPGGWACVWARGWEAGPSTMMWMTGSISR